MNMMDNPEQTTLNPLDYLIDQSKIDWHNCLAPWQAVLPDTFKIWIVNRFGDLFLELNDNSIHHLDIQLGTLTERGRDKKSFLENLLLKNNATDWLYMNHVDQAHNAGIHLKEAEIYTFRTPPVLSGEYVIENLTTAPATEVFPFLAHLHQHIKDLPEGAAIHLTLDEE